MRPFIRQAVTTVSASTLLLAAVTVKGVEDVGNPYADIVTRNAFSLRPPEPPKAPEPPKEEVAPSNIFMTGVTSIGGKKQVYLKVVTQGEKEPKYLRLGENERDGAIEVTEITPKTGRVRIKNRGVPSVISFETHGAQVAAAAPVAPVVPGRPPGLPPVPGAVPSPEGASKPVSSTLPVSPNNSAVNAVRPGSPTGGVPTVQPANQSAPTRSIPSRPLRVSPGGGASFEAPAAPSINPQVQAVQMEVNSQIQPSDFPPLPK